MTFRKIAILTIALLLPLSVGAQKKKKRVVKKPKVEIVEEPQEDPRITNMREMTQQIIIIDSIVVDKEQVLAQINLSAETGKLMPSGQLFKQSTNSMLFLNEMGNKAYFSQPDDSLRQQLMTSDKIGGEWSKPTLLKGISEGINEASYPFMMADGITFYFAGKGEESIGGYDIFMTRFDARSGQFLKPENIGMPFNSEANDYLYVVDEFSNIGYFVTDRRQPEGKACVYIFIPTETRSTYDTSKYSEEQIRNFADIHRIADTWGKGSERQNALARLNTLNSQLSAPALNFQLSTFNFQLIINDALTYSSVKDFRSSEAAALYGQLVKARHRLADLNSQLEKSRHYYQKADETERQALRKEILSGEEELQQLYSTIHQLEKQIRQTEQKVIN